MYTLDKLEKMCMFLGRDNSEGELATYLLSNLDNLSYMMLQNCVKETGLSKSSIQRFYTRGGFNSFKELTTVLSKEVNESLLVGYNLENYQDRIQSLFNDIDFDTPQIDRLINCISRASRVYFYGNQQEVDSMHYFISYLRAKNIKITSLNTWNIHLSHKRIGELDKQDILIIVDTSLKIQSLHEYSMNYQNLINIDKIKTKEFNKFFIGEKNCDDYLGFVNISVPTHEEDLMKIGLYVLDRYMYSKLMEE